MPDDIDNYPPQFCESCVSSVVGQINDFSGPYESDHTHTHIDSAPHQGGSASAGPLPVQLTAPKGELLPGLREALVASTILKLIKHLPPSNPFAKEIRASALGLYRSGGDRISAYKGGDTPKPRGKKTK